MWKGYEEALGRYGLTACEVWLELGFGDSCAATITADLLACGVSPIRSYAELAAADALPGWLFDEPVQRSHHPRWSARIPSTTGRCSATSRTTSPTSGRCVPRR